MSFEVEGMTLRNNGLTPDVNQFSKSQLANKQLLTKWLQNQENHEQTL
jgi:hypothetical protein